MGDTFKKFKCKDKEVRGGNPHYKNKQQLILDRGNPRECADRRGKEKGKLKPNSDGPGPNKSWEILALQEIVSVICAGLVV